MNVNTYTCTFINGVAFDDELVYNQTVRILNSIEKASPFKVIPTTPFACIGLDNAFLNNINSLQQAFTEFDYPECQPIIDLLETNKAFEIEPDYGNDSIDRCQKMLNDKFKNL